MYVNIEINLLVKSNIIRNQMFIHFNNKYFINTSCYSQKQKRSKNSKQQNI